MDMLCQIHAAEKVICHLANKGLVVVDQAVQRGSIAFLCQRTKPFIRLLHGLSFSNDRYDKNSSNSSRGL